MSDSSSLGLPVLEKSRCQTLTISVLARRDEHWELVLPDSKLSAGRGAIIGLMSSTLSPAMIHWEQ